MSNNLGVDPPTGPPVHLSRKKVRGEFGCKVDELSGQHVYACIQCGNCASGCPLHEEMDILPTRAMRLAQLGQKEELINSKSIWLCASCFQCTVRCPRGIDIEAVMDALRQIAMSEGIDYFGPDEINPEQAAEVPQPGLVGVYRKLST